MTRLAAILETYRRECHAIRAAMAAFFLAAVIYGGGKGDGGDRLLRRGAPPDSPNVACAFSGAEQAIGFACVTNPAAMAGLGASPVLAQFETTPNARAHAPWLATGVFDDYFTFTPDAPVSVGTNAVRRLMVFPHGRIKAVLENGGAAILAPFNAPMSFIAGGKWAECGVTSRCWTASSPTSTIVAWENALLGRDAARPLSFQVEFLKSGDVVYRYGDTDAVDTLAGATLSIGPLQPQAAGGAAQSATGPIGRASAICFADISRYGDGSGDADSDGLSDYAELVVHGTDPQSPDTDLDGLQDGDEIASGGDPLDFDFNGDGIPDGWDAEGYMAHPLWAPGNPDIVVSLASDLPPGVSALLRIGDLPVVLHPATNLPLRCAEGEMLDFRLRNPSGAAVPLSLSVISGNAYRLENNGLFAAGGLRRARADRPGPAGGVGTARLVFPKLSLVPENPDVPSCNGGTCIHGDGGDGIGFILSAEPSECAEIADHIVADGLLATGSRYIFFPPVGRNGTASVSVDGNWLTEGSATFSVTMHLAEFDPGAPCAACGGFHPPGFCEGSSPHDETDGAGLGRFLRIGETANVGGGWLNWFSHCCGPIGQPLARLEFSGASANLDVSMGGQDGMVAEGTGASGHPGADHIDYEVEVEGHGTFEGRMHFTVADIRLQFDYDGDGSIGDDEKDRAADAQTNSAAMAWAIPHRTEPYRVDCVVRACGELTARATWPSGTDGRVFRDSGLVTAAPPASTDFEDRDGPNTFWFATTNADAMASFGLSLSHDSVPGTILEEHLGIHVRGMDLGDRWVARESPHAVEYWRPSMDGEPFWTLRGPSATVAATAAGNSFTVAPASLDTGDYKVTALDPDLVREGFSHNTATGTLHVVETRLATNEIAIVRNATAGSAAGRQRLALAPEATQVADWRILPAGAGGARLYATATGGEPQTAITNAAAIWIGAGDAACDYTVTATHPHCPQSQDSATVSVVDALLVPDYDFDGFIDADDEAHLATNRTFVMWLNNDNDDASGINNHDGSEGGSGYEVPDCGYLYADWSDTKVNGLRDLIDWFPVCLDLSQLMDAFPVGGGYSYRFAQADNALSFVWTALGPDQAGSYLFGDIACAGQNFAHPVTNATVARISGGRVAIPADFLAQAGHDLVCLVEGRYASSAPLALEVVQGESLIARIEMPLRVAAVEDMFRFSNLRPPLGGSSSPQSRTGAPPYRPYVPNGKTVFLVHGFRVGANESRGWGSEFFKKLLRSGSRADFWMVTWESDASPTLDPLGIDYYMNVVNAFATAPHLANLVNSVQGDKIILAHSLGNMVVSSAIQDHNMQVDKYFALNSAVASEAYDAGLFDTATDNPLVHSEWVDYTNTCWSANYHDFFGSGDDRSRLTWRGRFADVPTLTEMFNFYSSGDEVLELGPQGITVLDWDTSVRQYTWHKQEAFKGRNVLYGSGWAGWGFESNVTAQAANAASSATLRDAPIFEHDPDEMFSAAITTNMQNRILAKGIPALSIPVGISLEAWDEEIEDKFFDMESLGNAPTRTGNAINNRWLHSDVQNAAYFFSKAIFDEFVNRGFLK